MILYHYTNARALEAILVEASLKPSLKGGRRRDVQYGEGQYLTSIPPGLLEPTQLSLILVRNFDEAYRFTHYVGINVEGLKVLQGRSTVFVIPGRDPLDLRGRIVVAGENR